MNPHRHALFATALLVAILGVALTSIRMFLRRSTDLSKVGGSALLRPGIRGWHYENLRPFEEALARWEVRPAWLSYLQLGIAVVVGIAYADGLIFIAGWLVLLAGSLDILDGRVARRTNRGSDRGAFLDSVIDRYADSFAFLGLAAFFNTTWMLWVVLFALVGALMVSYTRARAEGLGVSCLIGLLQRPERYVILGLGSIFGSLVDQITGWTLWGESYVVVVFTMIVLAVLGNVTAIQRAVHVLNALRERAGE
jgi:phosphatidylinositol phosphate synthase